MKRWGIVISAIYALVVVALLFPFGWYVGDEDSYFDGLIAITQPAEFGDAWGIKVFFGLFIAAQAALLFVSVDTTARRLKPRRAVAISVAAISFAVAALSFAILSNVLVALTADRIFDWEGFFLAVPIALWIFWGVVFFLYRERVSAHVNRAVGWLLNGSVLQLLIAVPTHILVRQRGDCSAPIVSGYGIATGVALMLMAFGPSVIFLYQDRLSQYERRAEMPLLAKFPVRTLIATILIIGIVLFALLSIEPPPPSSPPSFTLPL